MPLPVPRGALRILGHQRWLPYGVLERLLRFFVDPDRIASTPFECDFAGRRYRGDLSSYIDWIVYFYGAYEPGLLAFLGDVAQASGPGAIFVDVGANVGQHSLYLAPRVARVHAFEPWPAASAVLRRNVALNALTNITVHPHGLGDVAGEFPFYAPTSANLGSGSFIADVNANRPVGTLPVQRGDQAFAAAGIDRIDVIKIDAEGFEIKILAGMRESLVRLRPVVVFELSPPSAQNRETGARLATAVLDPLGDGWRLFRLIGAEDYRLEDFSYDGTGVVTAVLVPDRRAESLPRSGRWQAE